MTDQFFIDYRDSSGAVVRLTFPTWHLMQVAKRNIRSENLVAYGDLAAFLKKAA
jgi:hypothetical protein